MSVCSVYEVFYKIWERKSIDLPVKVRLHFFCYVRSRPVSRCVCFPTSIETTDEQQLLFHVKHEKDNKCLTLFSITMNLKRSKLDQIKNTQKRKRENCSGKSEADCGRNHCGRCYVFIYTIISVNNSQEIQLIDSSHSCLRNQEFMKSQVNSDENYCPPQLTLQVGNG